MRKHLRLSMPLNNQGMSVNAKLSAKPWPVLSLMIIEVSLMLMTRLEKRANPAL